MSKLTSPEASDVAGRLERNTVTDDIVQLYTNKPLPPLPTQSPTLPSSSATASTMTMKTFKTKLAGREGRSNTWSPPPGPTSSPSQSRTGTNNRYSGPAATGHRSSRKVQQLTGHDVDIMDDSLSVPYGGADSDLSTDSSSTYSHYLDDALFEIDHLDIPLADGRLSVLDTDKDGTSSRNSFWPPLSPHPGVWVPLHTSRPHIRYSDDSKLSDLGMSIRDVLDEDMPRRWDPAYGQFSDTKVAGQYHKIATELAGRPGRQTVDDSVLSYNASRDKSSVSVRFANNPTSGHRRQFPHSIDASVVSFSNGSHPTRTPHPAPPPLVSSERNSPRPNMRSAFDSDTDDEDEEQKQKRASKRKSRWAVRSSSFSDWSKTQAQTQSGPGHSQPEEETAAVAAGDRVGVWTKTGDQMKDLLATAKDRARLMQISKAERRREELRKQIKVVSARRETD